MAIERFLMRRWLLVMMRGQGEVFLILRFLFSLHPIVLPDSCFGHLDLRLGR